MFKTTLKKGDKVSLQSLSGGMAGDERFIHKFLIGEQRIKDMGLVPVRSEHSMKGFKFIAENPDKRAEDLMKAFKDPEIKMIIANIGGVDSHTIIPYLDLEVIKNNPKPVLGYSDTTSIHLLLYTLGIQTYYGPSVLDGFAENVEMHKITKESVETILFTNEEQEVIQAQEWTSEFLDWTNESFDYVKRKMNK
ncbi:LD-carboxypeptidase [Mycoplasma todarodis]|uniref:LD-carboxypeptidase N-terminal domain-containing protein n=1 Tax=Mycoplasma todarodis TaxID=1937191 RepID=A0A4R0XQB2_9MOLU|nr:LD-carboxypeptidase [Mycoplasma todarodis]TCG11065.1 hypothetical protein C4B25_02350 [Mycoplasma todarodis]